MLRMIVHGQGSSGKVLQQTTFYLFCLAKLEMARVFRENITSTEVIAHESVLLAGFVAFIQY